MTLTELVAKNAFRNRRRSLLTTLSIASSMLLLTLLLSIYHGFYLDPGTPQSTLRLITRHRVSVGFYLPAYYREKIRAVSGVVHVAPYNWFGGIYKDDKPGNFFPQFATDPNEIFDILQDKVPADQLAAFEHDRAGCAVDEALAKRFGWKLGDRILLRGTIYPFNPVLTIRAIVK